MTQIGVVKQWCDENLEPKAWYRIALRMTPQFKEHGVILFLLDKTELPDSLLGLINKEVKKTYNKSLPTTY